MTSSKFAAFLQNTFSEELLWRASPGHLHFFKKHTVSCFLSLSTIIIPQFHSYTKIVTLISFIRTPSSPHFHPDSPHSHPDSAHSHSDSPHSHPDFHHFYPNSSHSHRYSPHSHPDSPHSHPYSLHSHPDSPHSHSYSLHSHLDFPHSPHSHTDSPHSHDSFHSFPRFPIPAFTDKLWIFSYNDNYHQESCLATFLLVLSLVW